MTCRSKYGIKACGSTLFSVLHFLHFLLLKYSFKDTPFCISNSADYGQSASVGVRQQWELLPRYCLLACTVPHQRTDRRPSLVLPLPFPSPPDSPPQEATCRITAWRMRRITDEISYSRYPRCAPAKLQTTKLDRSAASRPAPPAQGRQPPPRTLVSSPQRTTPALRNGLPRRQCL